MSAKKRFTVKGCIGKIFYSPKEWEVDRETAFYYRIVNRNTGKKKMVKKGVFLCRDGRLSPSSVRMRF
jgi:hypothetical protein